jgi:lysophosphatidate acyltransferase
MDPISTVGLTAADVEELTRTTRDVMMAELISLTAKTRGVPMAVPVSSGKPSATASGADTKGL